jgi:hypothetical protein
MRSHTCQRHHRSRRECLSVWGQRTDSEHDDPSWLQFRLGRPAIAGTARGDGSYGQNELHAALQQRNQNRGNGLVYLKDGDLPSANFEPHLHDSTDVLYGICFRHAQGNFEVCFDHGDGDAFVYGRDGFGGCELGCDGKLR